MTLNKILTPTVIFAALSLAAAAPAGAAERHGGSSHGSRVYRGSVSRGTVRVAPRVVSRGVVVGPRYARPYYSFRPRFSVGFGIYAGYPVSYPYYYGYPYGYAYSAPYAYGYPPSSPYGYPSVSQPYEYPPSGYPSSNYPSPSYPPSNDPSSSYPPSRYPAGSAAPNDYPPQPSAGGSIGVQRGGQQSNAGGLSFEITPSTAAVFADGTYAGTVAMFDPTSEPLGLAPGRHHIEIRAAGYQTMAFDTDVTAGQVIPYQGTLQTAQ